MGRRGPQPKPLDQAFYQRVVTTKHGRMWNGSIRKEDGYGVFRKNYAHRIAWELARGPIPAGMEIDHLPTCPKHCVTVAHLALRGKSEHATVGWERDELNGGWGTARTRIHPPRPEAFKWQVETKCPVCSTSFLPSTGKVKFCSPVCRNRAKEAARKERKHAAAEYDYGPRTCIVCGQTFRYENAQQASRKRETCFRPCMYKLKNDERSRQTFEERGGAALFAPIKCEWCQEFFTPANRTMAGRQKYCSKRCGEMARRPRSS